PYRQLDSFPIHDELPLEEQARLYFSRAFRDVPDHALKTLWSEGKESIRVIGFSADTKSLLDSLPESTEPDLRLAGADPAQRRGKKREGLRVLPKLGQNLSSLAAGSAPPGARRGRLAERLGLLLSSTAQPVVVLGAPGAGKSAVRDAFVRDAL